MPAAPEDEDDDDDDDDDDDELLELDAGWPLDDELLELRLPDDELCSVMGAPASGASSNVARSVQPAMAIVTAAPMAS